MKKSLTILCLSLTVVSFAQFDKILQDPINDHPSFAGNSGKKRVTTFYAFEKRRNSQVMSYDFFSRKLKGAWGVRAANHRFYFNNEASLKVVYSPKFTSLKKDVTWSPAIGLEYINFYKDRYEEVFDFLVNQFIYPKSRTLNFSLGLSRNSMQSIFVTSVVYDPVFKSIIADCMYSYKLDRKKNSNWSSTFSISNKLMLRYRENYFYEGIYYNIWGADQKKREGISGHLVGQYENIQDRILGSYAITYKKWGLVLDADVAVFKKLLNYSTVKISEDGKRTGVYPLEKYGQYYFNNFGATLFWKNEKLTLFTKASMGFLQPLKDDGYESSADPVTPTTDEDGTVHGIATYPPAIVKINYKKFSFGVIYNF